MAIDKKKIVDILSDLGYYPLVDEEIEGLYQQWLAWYQGFVPDFHEYKNENGTKSGTTVKRYSTGIWKTVAEEWADNMWNPETSVIIQHDAIQKWWDNKELSLKFSDNMNDLEEKVMALGTMATTQYRDHMGRTQIDYLDLNNIIPLEVVNKEIVSVAFVSEYTEGVAYLNIHELQDDGSYLIMNKFYDVGDGNQALSEIPANIIYENGIEEVMLSPVKLFQIHTPAIVNNKVLGSPFGIPVLANAIDEVKALDIANDALVKEPQYGKIRVYLSGSAFDVNLDGEEVKILNENQEEFYVLKGDTLNEDGEMVTVSVPVLRETLINFFNTQLNNVGRKAGLGDHAFYSENGTIYTNTTQVISTESKFYKTRNKHGVIMRNNVDSIVKGLYWLETGKELLDNVIVEMDDSIIHDKDGEVNRALQMKNADIVSDVYVVQEWLGMTEDEAIEFVKRQRELKGTPEDIEFEE